MPDNNAGNQGLANPLGAVKARELVEDALSKGAVVVGGSFEPTKDSYFKPMVLDKVDSSMRI